MVILTDIWKSISVLETQSQSEPLGDARREIYSGRAEELLNCQQNEDWKKWTNILRINSG